MGGEPWGTLGDAGGQPVRLRAGAAGGGPPSPLQYRRGGPAGATAARRAPHAGHTHRCTHAAEVTG